MADKQVILLPKQDYFGWVKAAKDYCMRFNVNLTSDPETAANPPYTVITIANPTQGGFGRDVIRWFQTHYPQARLDVIDARNPQELNELLTVRLRKNSQFGY